MDRFTTSDGKIVGFEGDMDKLAEALLRLSKYEDTGLLPEEVAELQKKVERQDADIYFLLNRVGYLINKRNSVEMIFLKGENALLKAKAEKSKEEIKRLQDRITAAVDSLCETRCEDTTEPDPDAKLAQKQKIAWEAD